MKHAKMILSCVAVVAAVWVACSPEGPTSPPPEQKSEALDWKTIATPGGPSPTSTPAPTSTPVPGAEMSYVELNTDGSGKYCRLAKGGSSAYIVYTPPLQLSPIYGRYEATTAVNTCVAIPSANSVVDSITGLKIPFPGCGPLKIQVDANQDDYLAGRHMGHVMATVSGKDCPCVPEWVPLPDEEIYGPWSECAELPPPSHPGICARTREVTFIKREKNSCTGEIREVDRKTRTETDFTCECKKACTPVNLGDKNICFGCPLGNERDECAYFGLVPLGKDDDLSGGTFIATRDADLAIVKGANCYKLYSPVTKGQTLRGPEREAEIPCPNAQAALNCIDISHVTYCGCE